MASNDSQNNIDNTGEHHIKRSCLWEKNTGLECVEEDNSNPFYVAKRVEAIVNETGPNFRILIVFLAVILNYKQ